MLGKFVALSSVRPARVNSDRRDRTLREARYMFNRRLMRVLLPQTIAAFEFREVIPKRRIAKGPNTMSVGCSRRVPVRHDPSPSNTDTILPR